MIINKVMGPCKRKINTLAKKDLNVSEMSAHDTVTEIVYRVKVVMLYLDSGIAILLCELSSRVK